MQYKNITKDNHFQDTSLAKDTFVDLTGDRSAAPVMTAGAPVAPVLAAGAPEGCSQAIAPRPVRAPPHSRSRMPLPRPATARPRRERLCGSPRHWHLEPDEIYIGRGSSKHGFERSVWANPFVIGKDGTRDEVIKLFSKHLASSPDLLGRLGELAGLRLLCHCGEREPCHGDALISAFARARQDDCSDGPTSDEDEFGEAKAKHGAGWHGRGVPISVGRGAQRRPMRDGGGHCCPGNWPPERRSLPDFGEKILSIIDATIDEVAGRRGEDYWRKMVSAMA